MTIREKPKDIKLEKGPDGRNRPHCEDGPVAVFVDADTGEKTPIYAIHGVHLREELGHHIAVTDPKSITPELIDKTDNVEVRRILIDKYGRDRYLKVGDFEVIDEDKDQFGRPRRLLRKKIKGDEDILMTEVVDSSPKLAGTDGYLDEKTGLYYNIYMEAVDPELRPYTKDPIKFTEEELNMSREELIENKLLGRKQKLTVHNAVASGFRKYGKDYGKRGQIRQGDVLIEFNDGSNNLPFRES